MTLEIIKRHLLVFCWSCDEIPLKWEKKISEPPVYEEGSIDTTLDPPPKWSVNAFKFHLVEIFVDWSLKGFSVRYMFYIFDNLIELSAKMTLWDYYCEVHNLNAKSQKNCFAALNNTLIQCYKLKNITWQVCLTWECWILELLGWLVENLLELFPQRAVDQEVHRATQSQSLNGIWNWDGIHKEAKASGFFKDYFRPLDLLGFLN